MVLFAIAIVTVACIEACSKNQRTMEIMQTNGQEDDSDFNCQQTDNILFYNNYEVSKEGIPGGFIYKIIYMPLWRRHCECTCGLGICHLYVFKHKFFKSNRDQCPSRYIEYAIAIDTTAKGVHSSNFTLLLASDVSSLSLEDLYLYVDEDLYGFEEESDDMIFVPSGIYEYDGTLGEYGGYVIPYSYTFSSQH